MKWFQDYVGRWGNRIFGQATADSIVAHLQEEVDELEVSHDPEEAADCLLLLLQHAHDQDYDLFEEARRKQVTNERRTWGEPDEHGVVHHIKSNPTPQP